MAVRSSQTILMTRKLLSEGLVQDQYHLGVWGVVLRISFGEEIV